MALKKKINNVITHYNPDETMIIISSIRQNEDVKMYEFLNKHTLSVIGELYGQGTAKKTWRDMLGLSDNSYALFISIVSKLQVKETLDKINGEFYNETASGFAFSLGMDAYMGLNTFIRIFQGENKDGKSS
jgi:hypothetical protein